jgi:predicted nucleic acid-binding protein
MAVISNTSPILALSAIGRLDLLETQFGEVLIPTAVQAELKTETDFRGAKDIRQALKDGWLKLQAVENAYLAQALAMELDHGEAEAIALALETRSQVILLDEHDGRIKARAMGLQPIGVLGILLRAKKDGRVPSLKACIEALQSEVGFFVADELVQTILGQAGEM